MHPLIKEIPLYFLGTRNYVNGITLFEEMLKTYEKEAICSPGISCINSFKVNRFIRNNCLLKISEGKSEKSLGSLPSASIDLARVDKKIIKLRLYEDKSTPVKKVLPNYDRGIYVKKERVENEIHSAILHNINDGYSLVRGIVEANFRYCTLQAKEIDVTQGVVSWAYMKNFSWPNSYCRSKIKKIRFKKKSVLYSDYIYIIRKMAMCSCGDTFETELCFFFNNPSALRRSYE